MRISHVVPKLQKERNKGIKNKNIYYSSIISRNQLQVPDGKQFVPQYISQGPQAGLQDTPLGKHGI